MKVSHSFILGYVFAAAMTLMEQGVSQATPASSSNSGASLLGNFKQFNSAPDQVIYGSLARVQYQCSRPCELAVEVVVPTQQNTSLVVFRRKWISRKHHQVPRIHQVQFSFPPSIVYKQDFFIRHVFDTKSAIMHAWLNHLNDNETSTYDGSVVKAHKVLQTVPLSVHPTKPPTGCLSWSAGLMWQLTRDRIYQCPHETGTINMLKFPLASTGEGFGVVCKFQPFISRDLERARLHAVKQPNVTMSVWLYLLEWCHRGLCGIIHHVNRDNEYSFLMHLTNAGDVIIQARLTTGRDQAFQSHAALPRWTWIRLDCYIQQSKVTLDTTWDGETRTHAFDFQDNVHCDDTSGYFVIGGGRYLPALHGYFGAIKYYRFGTKQVENPLFRKNTLENLDKAHHECHEIKGFTATFLQGVYPGSNSGEISSSLYFISGFCNLHYITMWNKSRQPVCRQTWTWETQLKYRALFCFLRKQEEDLKIRLWGSNALRHLGRRLFEHAVGGMVRMVSKQIRLTSTDIDLLRVSSCFGNHQASLLLAAIHLAGLGRSVDQQQGHVYSLIGASADNRLALMHIGYKHTQGIDGFPKDHDMAYSYYANVGAQSIVDSQRIQEEKQYLPEQICLNNMEDLNGFADETSDAFQFLKFQAERGDVAPQKLLGKILLWGRNGASKDVASAMRWIVRSARRMDDPTIVYDYAILLLKGQGVKKNLTLGYQLLEKAAAMGSVHALNGLGWYCSAILKDHRTAVKYYEQAALNGSEDGMFNLGVYHLSGNNPDNPQRNEMAAFQLFLNASSFGHVAASVEAAWYLSTGCLEGVSRDVERAVIMLKKVCESNGHLGYIIREALKAYLQGSQGQALVKYAMAAEAGLGLAQTNVAHLFEEWKLSNDCQWRYYNHSTLNYDSHLHSLLKMGDYYYSSANRHEASLSSAGQAISMYSRAAVAGSPQGMYNLAALAQEGHVLPRSTRDFFNVSPHDTLETLLEKILQRCVAAEDKDAVTPCSLALLRVQMGNALRKMTQNGAQLLLAYASVLSLIIIIITVLVQLGLVLLQMTNEQRDNNHLAVEARTRTLSVNQAEVNWNTMQDNMMRRWGTVSRTCRVAMTLWLTILNGEQRLRQTSELAVTVSGVCLCAFWTTLLYHLL
ncbi:protein sel-1 homolog 3 [Lampris incognitus]|uniref:protein sel-1 homolog 3 n=1 Tax=Lampris incognitus TaxID=2546036 RepID=UPI0024B60E23|nr:protein sel-1 homolog 3 [Lampris incognitus]